MTIKFPLYQSHKQVRAAEITGVDTTTRRIVVMFMTSDEVPDAKSQTIMVEDSWLERFQPQPGMFLVEYADGYRSVSPASAFNGGYELIDEDKADDEWKAKAEPAAEAEQPAGNPTAPSSGISYGNS